MKNSLLRYLFMFILLIFFTSNICPQSTTTGVNNSFDTTNFPQWAKDLRRWEIVAFGTYPFTMFTTIFAMDTYRWINEGMDWSDEGRRYAPWPLKSAGAVDMTNKQYEMTMAIAAGASVALAIIDLVIVQIKRNKVRQRTEKLPVGTIIINRNPWPAEPESAQPEPESVMTEQENAQPDSENNILKENE